MDSKQEDIVYSGNETELGWESIVRSDNQGSMGLGTPGANTSQREFVAHIWIWSYPRQQCRTEEGKYYVVCKPKVE